MREIVEAQMELITGHSFNIIMTNFSKLVRIKPYKEEKHSLVINKHSFHESNQRSLYWDIRVERKK